MKITKRLPDLPLTRALAVLSGRWKIPVLYALREGAQRTCDLQNRIPGVSQKVLIEQLQALEEHGVVSRRPCPDHRQGIEYLLTPLGEGVLPALRSLSEWGTCHSRQFGEMDRLLSCEAVVRDRAQGQAVSQRTSDGSIASAKAM